MDVNVGQLDPSLYATKTVHAPLGRVHDKGGVSSLDRTNDFRTMANSVSSHDLRSALLSPSVRETIPGATVYSGSRPANNRPGMGINSSPIIDSNTSLGLS